MFMFLSHLSFSHKLSVFFCFSYSQCLPVSHLLVFTTVVPVVHTNRMFSWLLCLGEAGQEKNCSTNIWLSRSFPCTLTHKIKNTKTKSLALRNGYLANFLSSAKRTPGVTFLEEASPLVSRASRSRCSFPAYLLGFLQTSPDLPQSF